MEQIQSSDVAITFKLTIEIPKHPWVCARCGHAGEVHYVAWDPDDEPSDSKYSSCFHPEDDYPCLCSGYAPEKEQARLV